MQQQMWQRIKLGTVVVLMAAATACGPKSTPPPPPAPPPPPPPAIVIPPRPYAPQGAGENLIVPQLGPDGIRRTVNANISPAQITWNLRSAYNVAALNCLQPQHNDILVGYRAFLKAHARTLRTVNRTVDSEFRAKHGARFIAPRELYMTQVYNYFALPPTLPAFCEAALAMSRESLTVKSKDLGAFSARSLPQIELVFENFYRSYEQYKRDAALWEANYRHLLAPIAPPVTVK